MDGDYLLSGTISPRERVCLLLDRLEQQLSYAAALVTYSGPSSRGQLLLVNRGYSADVVEHAIEDFIPNAPAFRMIAAHPEQVFHWTTLPAFMSTPTVRDVLMPHGYRQGTSIVLRSAAQKPIGTLHISLNERRFPTQANNWLPAASRVLGRTVSTHQHAVSAALSPREIEVLRHLTAGLTNGEIAERLVISHSTASTHVENILRKLGASTRVQAAVQAVAFGLAPAEWPPSVSEAH